MRNTFAYIPHPNQIQLETEEIDPGSLQPQELLIETEWTFISSGTELANFTGIEPRMWEKGTGRYIPRRPGYANVGTVLAVGQQVNKAQVGERVFTYAKHESLAVFNQARLVYPVPQEVPSDLAVASRMAGVAATAILVSTIHGSPTVAVFGLGIVGNLASQMFRARGCRVIAVDPIQVRRQRAAEVGISTLGGSSPEEVQDQIMDLTDGQGADLVIEAVGHSAVCMQALAATRRFGQLVILGTPRAPVEGNLTDFLGEVHYRSIRVLGALEWRYPMYPAINADMSQFEKQRMVFDWLAEGRIQLEPLISHCLPPASIAEAYEGLLHKKEEFFGVALQWK